MRYIQKLLLFKLHFCINKTANYQMNSSLVGENVDKLVFDSMSDLSYEFGTKIHMYCVVSYRYILKRVGKTFNKINICF